jgi:hypothetical protein
MRRLTLVLAALTTLTALATTLPSRGLAQPLPQPGERVRILTVDGTSLTGTLTSASAEGMILGGRGGRSVRLADIAYVERSAGRYRRFGRNFALTTGTASLAGGMLAAITWTRCVSNQFLGCMLTPESRTEAFAWGAVAAGVLGMPVGVVVGLARRYDRWEALPLPGSRTSTVSIEPVFVGGFGLAGSLTF